MHSKSIRSLVEKSVFLGSSINLVQGAGGNLSVKEGNTIWIKASGTRLKDAASQEIFIPLSLQKTKQAVLHTESLNGFKKSKFKFRNLKPSIETAIHSLLPHKYVAHVHSVGAISVAVQENAELLLEEVTVAAQTIFIPYEKPGIPLAIKMLEKIEAEKIYSTDDLVALLGNHGLIVASESSSKVVEMILQFEANFNVPNLTYQKFEVTDTDWKVLFPKETLKEYEQEVLLGGALTPDEIVFLGPKPFSKEDCLDKDCKVRICKDGSVEIKIGLGLDAIEIVESLVKTAKLIPKGSKVNYLSNFDIQLLLNWDAEKWRISKQK